MNKTAAALAIISLAFSLCIAYPPATVAQSGSTVNLPITFHNYSLLLHDSNNSLYVYDGADGSAPDQAAATQTTVDSQITGQRSGFSYWSAVVIWTVKLPMDIHVQGSVNVHAYISSTYKLSGLFSGGGYAMGLVDIDENNNEVKEFLTEAPYTIGSNPFISNPTQYSQTVNVDYVFKAGHYLGFAVGVGATTQGYTATVYFGSQDRNSGATLPVVNTVSTQSFAVGDQSVAIASDSAISKFLYDMAGRSLSFLAQGIPATTGTCTVTIPKTLMQSPFTAASGTQPLTVMTTENATHSQLSFTHSRSSNPIKISGSASSPTTNPSQTTNPTDPSQTSAPSQTTLPSQAISRTASPTPSVPEIGDIAVPLLVTVLVAVFGFAALAKIRIQQSKQKRKRL